MPGLLRVGAAVVAAFCAGAGQATAQGNAPFAPVYLPQPVPGAPRGVDPDGWTRGKLCDITKPPYNAVGDGLSNSTAAIQTAIDDCGDRSDGEGGTVLVPANSGVFIAGTRVALVGVLRPMSIDGCLPSTHKPLGFC
jgi:hypothetical protein